jgi:hypothetical protein
MKIPQPSYIVDKLIPSILTTTESEDWVNIPTLYIEKLHKIMAQALDTGRG